MYDMLRIFNRQADEYIHQIDIKIKRCDKDSIEYGHVAVGFLNYVESFAITFNAKGYENHFKNCKTTIDGKITRYLSRCTLTHSLSMRMTAILIGLVSVLTLIIINISGHVLDRNYVIYDIDLDALLIFILIYIIAIISIFYVNSLNFKKRKI